jgi:hypothetical protein
VEEERNYHLIGEPFGNELPQVYELRIDDHVQYINPEDYGLKGEQFIKPSDYFITSGDAIEKTRILYRDLHDLANSLKDKCINAIVEDSQCTSEKAQKTYDRGVPNKKWSKLQEYATEVARVAIDGSILLHELIKAKGPNVFLETEWNSHHLLCIPKNPRKAQI